MKVGNLELQQMDEHGNIVCQDCMAHVNASYFPSHICPPWLKALVKGKKASI